jgi:cytochrome c oxidase assembly factor 2
VEKEGGAIESQSVEKVDDRVKSAIKDSHMKRECPIPKPGGIVGEILGFRPSNSDGKGSKPP